ncbi:hypothetical protein J1N35_041875 [Gossypium stocksii]|uniref:Uncharacterized protein n=1 Tax=Gossypium stocksii TaxID=47602 RepID=A0A9D3UGK6_9ROSI|nr:hypothetical protein J1N35_041875 [Gossypium stocksii]
MNEELYEGSKYSKMSFCIHLFHLKCLGGLIGNSSFILSMIIPGEKGPENDIDIYLQPLIEELKQLWVSVETYDILRKENFYLRVALLWSINDFPTYANLSDWSTKGCYACPCCVTQTCSK